MFENEIRSRTIKMDNPIDQDGQPLVQEFQRERVGGALAVLQGPLLSIAASANTACCFSTSATHMGSHDAAKGSTSLLHPCTPICQAVPWLGMTAITMSAWHGRRSGRAAAARRARCGPCGHTCGLLFSVY